MIIFIYSQNLYFIKFQAHIQHLHHKEVVSIYRVLIAATSFLIICNSKPSNLHSFEKVPKAGLALNTGWPIQIMWDVVKGEQNLFQIQFKLAGDQASKPLIKITYVVHRQNWLVAGPYEDNLGGYQVCVCIVV